MANYPDERDALDKLIEATNAYDDTKIPSQLSANLSKWKWGRYGWVSPASLIVTAAWVKARNPSQDCCKIWADDERGRSIPGGYSIRSKDESLTVPLFAKHDLCKGFCSDNSGMQGSRAIEKMRTLKRLEVNFSASQKTVFDLKLFAKILNDINDLNANQALELVKRLIVLAKSIKLARQHMDVALGKTTATFNVLDFLADVADPELTKCVAAACLEALYGPVGFHLTGVEDYKTAADSVAKKPGDLALSIGGNVIVAAEVKAKSISLDWQNIARATKIIAKFPTMMTFLFVLERRSAVTEDIIREFLKSPTLATSVGVKIAFISLHDLYSLALAVSSAEDLTVRTGQLLSLAPSAEPSTKDAWLAKTR